MKDGKILIVGACGFVGSHMYRALGAERAMGTWFHVPFEGGIRFDALTQDLAEVLKPEGIAHVMVFYGDTMPDSCAKNPALSQALNVDSTKRVIDRLVAWGLPFTFTSSESVFDGTSGPSDENTPPNPIMLYGRQKLEIEDYLRDVHPDAPWTIMRFGKVFGATSVNEKLFTGWIDAIEAGRKIRIATDQVFSPIFVDDVVKACVMAAERDLRGLFHLCGARPFSRYELLEMLIAEVRRHRPVDVEIEKCSIDDFDLLEPRPKDVSMRVDKLVAAIGITITPTEAVCRRIVDDYFSRKA